MTPFDILAQPAYLAVVCLIVGMTIGSFLNVVIHRLPLMLEREGQAYCAELRNEAPPALEPFNLAVPRSRCPHCGHMIRALENIPVVSYLALRGRCRACRAAISPRYPAVELLTGLLSAFAAWHFGGSWAAAGALLYIWAMIALTFIDFDTQLLPDDLTLPLLWAGLLLNLTPYGYTDPSSAVTGAAAGYLTLYLVSRGYGLVTGKIGMGHGDFKLLAAIGAWLGWKVLPLVILLSSCVGAVVGLSLILFAGHQRDNPIPFGPYIAAAGVIALFWGNELTLAYLRTI